MKNKIRAFFLAVSALYTMQAEAQVKKVDIAGVCRICAGE